VDPVPAPDRGAVAVLVKAAEADTALVLAKVLAR
jgi:hypothetical protein